MNSDADFAACSCLPRLNRRGRTNAFGLIKPFVVRICTYFGQKARQEQSPRQRAVVETGDPKRCQSQSDASRWLLGDCTERMSLYKEHRVTASLESARRTSSVASILGGATCKSDVRRFYSQLTLKPSISFEGREYWIMVEESR